MKITVMSLKIIYKCDKNVCSQSSNIMLCQNIILIKKSQNYNIFKEENYTTNITIF